MPLRPAAAAAALAVAIGAIAAPAGHAQPDLRSPGTAAPLRASLGYLAGNGLGELGAEIAFRAWPHVSLGLQAGRIAGTAGAGFGLAPLVRVGLWPHDGPYAALGATWFSFQADATTRVSGTGLLAGVGYEWRPAPQFALLGGVGLAFVPTTAIDRAGVTSSAAGGLKPNFELGARWYAF